jgi:farnesyl-diphosphate farnesyltransferase
MSADPQRVDPVQAPASTTADLAFCVQILPEVSRTFALSIERLPDPLREPVRIGYLLCRIVDTIEDDAALPLDARERLFATFDAAVEGHPGAARDLEKVAELLDAGDVPAERELIRRSTAVFRRYEALPDGDRQALRRPILEMSHGMRAYARRNDAEGQLRLRDIADLERYCYFVAGTVGKLLTHLFLRANPGLSAERRARALDDAVPFGIALQIVNIVKDTAEDQERGVCFLPTEVVRAHGLTVPQLLEPEHREAALGVVADVCRVAVGHLQRAMRYTSQWPADGGMGSAVRRFCLVPLVLALETLAVVVDGADTLVPGRTPKVTRDVVAETVMTCERAAVDEAAFQELVARWSLEDLPI